MSQSTSAIRPTLITATAVFLAACSCGAVYSGWSWLPNVIATIALVASASLVGRWLRVPMLLQPLVTLAALLVWTTARFASAEAYGRVVPTSAAWDELAQKYSYGIHDLTASSVPVVTNANNLVVLTAGIGLMALAADLLSVGAGRPSLAGLPMLAIVVVAAGARHGGIGLLPFLLAALGYLLLLGVDSGDRVERWGRILPERGAGSTSAASGSASVWRIGTATLGLALLVPVLIPGADYSRLGGSSGFGSGGSSSTIVVNPLSTIQSQLQASDTTVLLHVRTDVPTYQRLTALDNFSSNGFTLVPLSAGRDDKVSGGGLSKVDRPPQAKTARETVTAEPVFKQAFLPIPENPSAINVDGDWRLSTPTQTVFSSRTTTSGKSWTSVGSLPTPTADELRAEGAPRQPSYPREIAAADLDVPRDLPPEVRDTARAWVREAGATTIYDIANALQTNFTGPDFSYDVNVSISAGPDGFREFLRDRRGYCQQYATTMVAMLRTLGIPARVAIGFTEGQQQPDGSYQITNRDAHAWPEVYFTNIGWVRFEPTPLSNGNALVPAYTAAPDTQTTPGDPNDTTAPTAEPSSDATPGPSASSNKQAPTDRTATSPTASNDLRPILGGTLGFVGVVVIAGIPWFTRRTRRRVRWRNAVESRSELVPRRTAEAAWADVLEDAGDRGVSIPPSASPRRTGQLLLAALASVPVPKSDLGTPNDELDADGIVSNTAAAVDLLVSAIEQARYRPVSLPTPPAQLRAAADLVGRQLVERQAPRERIVASAFPPSTRTLWITPLRDWVQAVTRTIDGVLANSEERLRRLRGSGRPQSPEPTRSQ